MRLLAEISLFLVAALGLGVGVGWLLWRAGRRSVPEAEWRRLQRRAEQLTEHLATLQHRLGTEEHGRRVAEDEARRTRHLLERAWADREALQARSELLERETVAARHDRDLATERLGQLQRRLAQLSVQRARTGGVVPGVIATDHAPPDPQRIGLAALPAPLAPAGRPPSTPPPPPPPGALPGGPYLDLLDLDGPAAAERAPATPSPTGRRPEP